MYAPEVYQKAHDMLEEWIKRGSFVQDQQKCYYLYELTMDGRSQTGLVACASIDDYLNGVIKSMKIQGQKKSRTVSDTWIPAMPEPDRSFLPTAKIRRSQR